MCAGSACNLRSHHGKLIMYINTNQSERAGLSWRSVVILMLVLRNLAHGHVLLKSNSGQNPGKKGATLESRSRNFLVLVVIMRFPAQVCHALMLYVSSFQGSHYNFSFFICISEAKYCGLRETLKRCCTAANYSWKQNQSKILLQSMDRSNADQIKVMVLPASAASSVV